MRKSTVAAMLLTVSAVVMMGADGCQKKVVSGVSTSADPAKNSFTFQVNFDQSFKTDLSGNFDIKIKGVDYGSIFVKAPMGDQPLNVGTTFNLDILKAQNYVDGTVMETLPSGQRLPAEIGRPMLAVSLGTAVSKNFDVYLYIDSSAEAREWLGIVLTLKFVNQDFPMDLAFSQGFLYGPTNFPRLSVGAYGGRAEKDGQVTTYGGLAAFVNVRSLIEHPPTALELKNP